MTNAEKLDIVTTLMEDTGDVPDGNVLSAYIDLAGKEILNWMYHQVGGVPESVTEVPAKYEATQIYAVIVGYTHAGAEGQKLHIENGVHRDFNYVDMLDYIHQKVLPYVRVGAIS